MSAPTELPLTTTCVALDLGLIRCLRKSMAPSRRIGALWRVKLAAPAAPSHRTGGVRVVDRRLRPRTTLPLLIYVIRQLISLMHDVGILLGRTFMTWRACHAATRRARRRAAPASRPPHPDGGCMGGCSACPGSYQLDGCLLTVTPSSPGVVAPAGDWAATTR